MKDDLSVYRNYRGEPPPAIEQTKFLLSSGANELIACGDYVAAAKQKLKVARICRSQGKDRDRHHLETSAYELIQKAAREKGQYMEAAKALHDWASRLRADGFERDAYLMDTTACQLGQHSRY